MENNVDPSLTKKQSVEFGLLSILITLLLAVFNNNISIVAAAIVLVLITMLLPITLYPFAWLWFKLVKVMSIFGPVIMLSIIFYLVVIPMGAFRKLLGKDSLRRKEFKKDTQSVMQTRDHLYSTEDFLHMF
jgi:predicted membrane protein